MKVPEVCVAVAGLLSTNHGSFVAELSLVLATRVVRMPVCVRPALT